MFIFHCIIFWSGTDRELKYFIIYRFFIVIMFRIRIIISFIARYEEFVLVTEAPQCNRMSVTGQDTDNKKIMYKYTNLLLLLLFDDEMARFVVSTSQEHVAVIMRNSPSVVIIQCVCDVYCFTEHCISESLILNVEKVRYYGDFKNTLHPCWCGKQMACGVR